MHTPRLNVTDMQFTLILYSFNMSDLHTPSLLKPRRFTYHVCYVPDAVCVVVVIRGYFVRSGKVGIILLHYQLILHSLQLIRVYFNFVCGIPCSYLSLCIKFSTSNYLKKKLKIKHLVNTIIVMLPEIVCILCLRLQQLKTGWVDINFTYIFLLCVLHIPRNVTRYDNTRMLCYNINMGLNILRYVL